MKKILAATLAVALTIGMAAPAQALDRSDAGLLLGALGGGVVGHQFGKGKGNTWATAIGAVTGAVVGQSVGTSLDRGERAYRNRYHSGWGQGNYYQAKPVYYTSPAPVYYVSPSYETRIRSYEVRPQPVNFYSYSVDNSVNDTSGRYCREYQAPVTVGGRTQGSYGTACMQPDGSWEVIK